MLEMCDRVSCSIMAPFSAVINRFMRIFIKRKWLQQNISENRDARQHKECDTNLVKRRLAKDQ